MSPALVRTVGPVLARSVPLVAFVALVVLVTVGCASSGSDDGPMVDRIDDAIFAVETEYQAPLDYFEISASTERVSVIVAVDDASAAEQAFWSPDGGLVEPVRLDGVGSGETFRSSELDFDPATVLDQVRDELPDSEIVDFAVIGGPGDAVQYSARIASERGGALVVQLAGDGAILGAVAG